MLQTDLQRFGFNRNQYVATESLALGAASLRH